MSVSCKVLPTNLPGRQDTSPNIHCMEVTEGISNALTERLLVIRIIKAG